MAKDNLETRTKNNQYDSAGVIGIAVGLGLTYCFMPEIEAENPYQMAYNLTSFYIGAAAGCFSSMLAYSYITYDKKSEDKIKDEN